MRSTKPGRGRASQSMQHISAIHIPQPFQHGGGRVGSEAYRQSLDFCDDFAGLEEGVNRYDLLLLVKKVGKHAGFTPRMIQLLDYYFAFTRDVDWEEGSRPIVYQSLSRTALDLGVSERQIQKLERSLFDVGAITWHDSGNHRRYGQRHPETGRILYAYGIELTPLVSLLEDLAATLREKQARDALWMERKRQISWYRSQIRGILLELAEEGACPSLPTFQSRYDAIAIQIRSHIDLDRLAELIDEHKALYSDLRSLAQQNTAESEEGTLRSPMPQETHKCSSKSEQKFAYYKSTTQQSFNKLNTGKPPVNCFQGSVVEGPAPANAFHSSGIDHVKLKMAIEASSERFQTHLPFDPTWPDVIEAAYHLRNEMGISQASWGRGCELLGRTGAALCVLITDRARDRDSDPVRSPAAYFNGMLKRAADEQLYLHKSIFGQSMKRHGVTDRIGVESMHDVV